jgi:hypothetical protein
LGSVIDSDLIDSIIEYLGLQDSIQRLSLLSKISNNKVINHYLIHKKDVEEAKPLERSGMRLCHLLEVARFLALNLHVVAVSEGARRLVEKSNSLAGLRHPQYMQDLAFLNAGIYTYWDTTPADPQHGLYDHLKDYVEQNDAPHDKDIVKAVKKDCQYWKTSRIHGSFIVLLERPDGTILVSQDCKQVYLVLGQAQSLGEVANFIYRNGMPAKGTPYSSPKFHSRLIGSRILTTLINWEDKIVYDGLLHPEEQPEKSTVRKALQAYIQAVNKKTLMVTLVKKKVDTPKVEVFSSGEFDRVKTEYRHVLDEMKTFPTIPSMWVVRRYGYTEKENPNHLVTLLSSPQGECLVPMYQTKELIPSVQEYITLFHEAMVKARHKPQQVAIDADVRVDMIRSLFQLADIKVGYYPPPSAEERKMSDATNPRLRNACCAVCEARHCADGTKLLVCSRCRSEYYCCKEHQKQHWKRHKQFCF